MGCHACGDCQRRKGHGTSAEGGLGGRDTLSAWPSMASVGWKWRGRATSTRRGGSHLRVSNERPRSLSAPHQSSDCIRRAHPWVFWTSEKGHAPLYLAVP